MKHIIDEPEFEYVKNSLLEIDEKDREFATKLVDYINDTSWNEDDEFFYDMLEFLRFTKQTPLAETDIYGLIYLNPPQGKTVKNWDFYYCHECMHQLWDTFGVADKIKSKGIKYDHELLNIASDCVINDYLKVTRGKDGTNDIIYPEDIEKAYGVVYDRRKDTQFTLYLKILATGKGASALSKSPWGGKTLKPRKITRVPPQGGPKGPDINLEYSEDFVKGWTDAINDVLNGKVNPLKFKPLPTVTESLNLNLGGTYEDGYNKAMEIMAEGMKNGVTVQSPGGDFGGSGGRTNIPEIPWDIPQDPNQKGKKGESGGSGKSAEQEVAEAAQAAAQADAATRSMSGKMGDPHSQDLADEAKKSAKRAKDAANKASKTLAHGDEEEARKQAGIAKSEAANAIGKALEAQGLKPEKNPRKSPKGPDGKGSDGKGSDGDSPGRGRSENGQWSKTFEREQTDMDKIKRAHDDIIKKVTSKITGDLGRFLDKCRDSKDLKGLETKSERGMNGWGKRALKAVNSYIEDTWGNPRWESTYKKFNKKQGIPKEGDLLMKGKRKIRDKFNLLMNFFLDRSYSMNGARIENACDAMYSVARGLKKNWTNTETIEKVDFGFYTWGTGEIAQINMGQVPKADDGTDPIDKTVKKIVDGGYMANVNFILTDGETNVNEPQMESLLSSSHDMWVIVCISGKDASTHQSLMSRFKNYIWIQCSASFE